MAKNIFEIKEEHKSAIVGFNNSGLPLGERNDLDKLAELAYVNKNLAIYFIQLPSLKQIQKYKADKFLSATPEAVTPMEEVILEQTPDNNSSVEQETITVTEEAK